MVADPLVAGATVRHRGVDNEIEARWGGDGARRRYITAGGRNGTLFCRARSGRISGWGYHARHLQANQRNRAIADLLDVGSYRDRRLHTHNWCFGSIPIRQ